jgi:hypothetical protein
MSLSCLGALADFAPLYELQDIIASVNMGSMSLLVIGLGLVQNVFVSILFLLIRKCLEIFHVLQGLLSESTWKYPGHYFH